MSVSIVPVNQIQGHALLQFCLRIGEEEVTKEMISRGRDLVTAVTEGGVLDVVGKGPQCTI